jgi:hypothetical protein
MLRNFVHHRKADEPPSNRGSMLRGTEIVAVGRRAVSVVIFTV